MDETGFNHPDAELTEQEGAQTLAAIDWGIEYAEAGRVLNFEEGRNYIEQWDAKNFQHRTALEGLSRPN